MKENEKCENLKDDKSQMDLIDRMLDEVSAKGQ